MKTGIVKCGYAPITAGENGAITFGTPIYFADAEAGTREYSVDPKGDVHPVWANSVLVYMGNKNSGYDINLTLIDFIDDIAKSWYNDVSVTMGQKSGIAETGQATERPHFALIISEETTDGTGKTTVFFNCCAGKKPSMAGKTAEDGDWDDQFPEYALIAAPAVDVTTDKKWVKMEIPGVETLGSISFPTITT